MSARIEKLIGHATLQGLPLAGLRRFGVPPGGAFDVESFLLANCLLGNETDAATIELANASVEIAFTVATRVAVVGAPADVDGGTINAAFGVAPGSVLKVAAAREGLCVYVGVAGGWIPDGIESRVARHGRRVSAGDVFECRETAANATVERLAHPPASLASGPIRVVSGPQPIVRLSPSDETPTFKVSHQSDRTGIRVEGFSHRELEELVSEPACPGAIQLTPSGQIILIGPDGPTIGGYPKPAVVCSADLDRLAHLRPGQEVSFEEIDIETARALAAERDARIARTIAQIGIRLGG